jgi:hypothetical protein
MIDFARGEYSTYSNTYELFNEWWNEYAAWYALMYDPASGKGEIKGYYVSAYAIAVKHGYKGTEEEWLSELDLRVKDAEKHASDSAASAAAAMIAVTKYPMIGEDGYWYVWDTVLGEYKKTSAKAKGDSFRYEDFTPEQLAALEGDPGKSAYQYAVEAGYPDSEEQFADDLANVGNTSGDGGNVDFSEFENITSLDPRDAFIVYDTPEGEPKKIAWEGLYPLIKDKLDKDSVIAKALTDKAGTGYVAIIPELEENAEIALKSDIANALVNYYKKSETYSRTEIDGKISAIPKFAIEVVSALPTANISDTTVYLLLTNPGDTQGQIYTEYIYVNGKWEKLGEQKIDLVGYATEAYVQNYAQQKGDYIEQSQLNSAVDDALAEAKASGEFDGADGKDGSVWWFINRYIDGASLNMVSDDAKDGDYCLHVTEGHVYYAKDGKWKQIGNIKGAAPIKGKDYFTEADKEEIVGELADAAPVRSVNGKTGAVNLAADDVGARPSTWTPTYTDVGAEKSGTAASAVSTHNTKADAHNDIRLLISGLSNRLDALANSDDDTLDQMAEVVAYIKANRDLIEQITTGKVSVTDIVNNLTTNVANKPLSAAQGVALKALIDAITVPTKLSELTEDSTHRVVTDTEKTAWNAKSDFSGKYADLSGKPTLPTVPTNVSAFNNDAGYLKESVLNSAVDSALAEAKASGEFDGAPGAPGYTPIRGKDYLTPEDEAEWSEYIASELAKRGQLKPEYAQSIEECTDTTKLYVLPDGMIYAYMYTEVEVGGYTNVVGTSKTGFKTGYRIKASGGEPVTASGADATTAFVSNIFSCKEGDVLRIRGVGKSNTNSAVAPVFMVVPVTSDGAVVSNHGFCLVEPLYNSTQILFTTWKQAWNAIETADDGTITWTYAINNAGEQKAGMSLTEPTTAVRLAGTALNGFENVIVTVNEEIIEPTTTKEYAWASTGHAFVPADYEGRIVAIEDDVSDLKGKVPELEDSISDLEDDVSAIKEAMLFDGLLNYDIFDYAYIKGGELVANALNVTGNQHGHYTGVKMTGNVKRIMCKAKLFAPSVVTLISTKLGSSFVSNIVRGSIHLIFNVSGCSVGIYDEGTTTLRNVVQYSCPVTEGVEVAFGYSVNEATNTLTVYLPDGTTKTLTDEALSVVNGEYAIWEHFCNTSSSEFKCCHITKLWCEDTNGDVLDDDLKRLDGAIGVAPTGQPYRQFRTGQQTNRDFV